MKPKLIPLRLKQLLVLQNGKELKNKFCLNRKDQLHSFNRKQSSLNSYPSILSFLHKKLYIKYNSSPKIFIKKQLSILLRSQQGHLVSVFKDQILFGFPGEFLRRLYPIEEIKNRLFKFPEFYQKYFLFFCKPSFRHASLNKSIHKYYEKKAEMYYFDNYCESNTPKETDSFFVPKIFSTTINKDINQKTITTSNIVQTNFEYGTNKNALSRKRFIESMSECSLIYKNYKKTILQSEADFINESWSPYLKNINIPPTVDYSGDIFNSPRESFFSPENVVSLRFQHSKLQSISDKIAMNQLNSLKLKPQEVKNQPSLQKVLSSHNAQVNMKEAKKNHPEIFIEFSNRQKKYNRCILPHTKSTGDLMKVSLVIYTQQNGRNKLKGKSPPTEFELSSPTLNNVNINIHSKVNLSPTIMNNNIQNKISQFKLISADNQLSPWKSSSRNTIDLHSNRYPHNDGKSKGLNKRTISLQSKKLKTKLNLNNNVIDNKMRLAKITETLTRVNSDPFYKYKVNALKKDNQEPKKHFNQQNIIRVNSQAKITKLKLL